MKKENQEEKNEILKHSTAHILAAAVLEMFPEAKFGIGPAIEDGFYYDFDLPRTLIPEDLEILEGKMQSIVKENHLFERRDISIEEALEHFTKLNQTYKIELINDLKTAGETTVSVYKSGHFTDLCRGPHVESTKEINSQAFKLTKISGAYWKADEKNTQLQRIYGVVFNDKKELKEYLKQQEEAKLRDHRKLGRELDLFHIDEKVGLGLPLWHPKGAMLWRVIEDFWYKEHQKNGYELVRSPHIGGRNLWETSGHWGFYNASMYPPIEVGQTLEEKQNEIKAKESEEFLLKPMNCPFHVQIFKNTPKSYRDLPCRWAECGTVYRFEKKGELSGLTRVRGFTQDDAHIICQKSQVEEELKKVIDFILFIYQSFGFAKDDVKVFLSLRDPKNTVKYAGDDAGWEFTQEVLRKVAAEKGLDFIEEEGEAAFYGPKLDFKIKDCLGRMWQCSTLQFDFNLPERFEMSFTNNLGEDEKPFVLHRALFGSFERFIGLLIEHYAGAFPTWLSPVQISIVPVSEKFNDYAKEVRDKLLAQGLRVELNIKDESLGKRIREEEKSKVPHILIIGEKEVADSTVTVRSRGIKEQQTLKVDEFVSKIEKEVNEKK
ncbi:MAG: threonine--tRNA ligase [Candidatus Moranbacteria bacterium]|jgi:threonyl-tRNA synthetase|nr:threonine--tRNA ligase [Candidatus Moranbacteria bacterium]